MLMFRTVLRAALISGMGKNFTPDQVGDLIDEAGIEPISKALNEAITFAFPVKAPAADEAEGEGASSPETLLDVLGGTPAEGGRWRALPLRVLGDDAKGNQDASRGDRGARSEGALLEHRPRMDERGASATTATPAPISVAPRGLRAAEGPLSR